MTLKALRVPAIVSGLIFSAGTKRRLCRQFLIHFDATLRSFRLLVLLFFVFLMLFVGVLFLTLLPVFLAFISHRAPFFPLSAIKRSEKPSGHFTCPALSRSILARRFFSPGRISDERVHWDAYSDLLESGCNLNTMNGLSRSLRRTFLKLFRFVDLSKSLSSGFCGIFRSASRDTLFLIFRHPCRE